MSLFVLLLTFFSFGFCADSYNHFKESGGKSSDSSLSSIHGYRRFNDDHIIGGGSGGLNSTLIGSGGGGGSANDSLRVGSLQKHRSRKEGSGGR